MRVRSTRSLHFLSSLLPDAVVFSIFQTRKNGFQLVAVALVLGFSSLQLEAQEMMSRGKRHKVELEGESLRPARAFQITHSVCPIAGEHFAKARKMRRWNAVL